MPPLLIGAVPYEEIRGGAVCLLASMVHRILRPDEKCSFLKMLGELRKRWNRGPRDNCLKCCGKVWSWREESNLQPAVYKTVSRGLLKYWIKWAIPSSLLLITNF